jgi:hypothetical protein
MNIVGSIHANLRAALQSARRLKDGPVHQDTVDHWAMLVARAKAEEAAMQSFRTRELMSDLEREISARSTDDQVAHRPAPENIKADLETGRKGFRP